MQVKSNVKGNVTVGIYNSLCQYYDESTSSWAYNGCEATDESVPSCIACKCNHMTSYGGSVILSPDQIDFTDLTVSIPYILHPEHCDSQSPKNGIYQKEYGSHCKYQQFSSIDGNCGIF